MVTWDVSAPDTSLGYLVAHRDLDTGKRITSDTLPPETRSYVLEDVEKDRKYIVCIEALMNTTNQDNNVIRKCEYVETKQGWLVPWLYVLIAAAVVVLCLIVLVACCMIQRHPRKTAQKNGQARLVDSERGAGGSDLFGHSNAVSASSSLNDLQETAYAHMPVSNMSYKLPPTLRTAAFSTTKPSHLGSRERLDFGSRDKLDKLGSRERLHSGSMEFR